MLNGIPSPAQLTYWSIPGPVLFSVIALVGLACFAYIVAKRLTPLIRGEHDIRFDRPLLRLEKVVKYWLVQWKQPRYMLAGVLHIVVFAGFLALSFRSISLVIIGIVGSSDASSLSVAVRHAYSVATCYAATLVFVAVVVAAVRRTVFKPARYMVPPQYGKGHATEALIVLGFIVALMVSASIFEATAAAFQDLRGQTAEAPPWLSLAWMFEGLMHSAQPGSLRDLNLAAYFLHDLTFAAAVVFASEVEARTKKDPRVQALTETMNKAMSKVDGVEKNRLRAQWDELFKSVHSEKLGEMAEEFDKVHSVYRALEVGALHHILPPANLRPYLIHAVEAGIAREMESRAGKSQDENSPTVIAAEPTLA